jgi:hypothetical protein
MAGKDLATTFTHVIKLDEHDNSEVKRSVLNRTEAKYNRILNIFGPVSIPSSFPEHCQVFTIPLQVPQTAS